MVENKLVWLNFETKLVQHVDLDELDASSNP